MYEICWHDDEGNEQTAEGESLADLARALEAVDYQGPVEDIDFDLTRE